MYISRETIIVLLCDFQNHISKIDSCNWRQMNFDGNMHVNLKNNNRRNSSVNDKYVKLMYTFEVLKTT